MAEVVFKSRMTRVPTKAAKIYRLQIPPVDRRSLLRTAKQFGIATDKREGRIAEGREDITYTEGQYELSVVKASGAFRFSDTSRWQVDDGVTNIRMSDKAAITAAKKHVKKYKLASLRDCRVFKVSRLRVGTLKKGERSVKERVIDVAVVFQRLIGGLPVEGPGGKLGIYLDRQGQMTACEMLWRPLGRALRPVPFRERRTPADAERSLKRASSRFGAARVEVEDMKFGYYAAGMCEIQRTLQPAYVMPIQVKSADSEMVMKSVQVYPAAKKPVGRIIRPKKRRPPQPVRRS